jgi:hypothetical protein
MTPADDQRIFEIHTTVQTMSGRMERMEEKVCGELGVITQLKDHEGRIRAINNKVNWFSGVASAVGMIVGALLKKIW